MTQPAAYPKRAGGAALPMHSAEEIEAAMITLARLMQASPYGAAMAPIFDRLERELKAARGRMTAVDKAAAFLAEHMAQN